MPLDSCGGRRVADRGRGPVTCALLLCLVAVCTACGGGGTGGCLAGRYGPDCLACSCLNGATCDDGRTGTGACTCTAGFVGADCGTACTVAWDAPTATPISALTFNVGVTNILWNDPTVIKEGPASYRMWLSGGVLGITPKVVEVFEATSVDGVAWTIDLSPQLSPGPPGSWDDAFVETPSVVRDGQGTYHLYYSGQADGTVNTGMYAIGHATSTDGRNWTKDPGNPVIDVVRGAETSDWGTFTAAEPGAVYVPASDEIFVYYVGAGASADHDGTFSILLATSTDGSAFTHHRDGLGNREPVWSLSANYPAATYRGYSTPAVTRVDGSFYLSHDVVKQPMFEQVAIALAKSADGIAFVEDQINIVQAGAATWVDFETRGQFLLPDDGDFKLYFAGNNDLATVGPNNFTGGIGVISGQQTCP